MLVTFMLVALFSTLTSAQTGVASFSSSINWSQTSPLYFNVNGGPPSMCGALVTTRNGTLSTTPGWICTDSNGNATNGPWSWAGQSSDQTDRKVHIDWTNGTTTNANSDHIWDKTCPTIAPASAVVYTSNFSGTGSDAQWGAGFLRADGNTVIRGTTVKLVFREDDPSGALYWDPNTDTYNLSSPPTIYANITGFGTFSSPSYSMTWSAPKTPSRGAHTDGIHYTWTATLADEDTRCTPNSFPQLVSTRTFTYHMIF
jgi:hypothetical protein